MDESKKIMGMLAALSAPARRCRCGAEVDDYLPACAACLPVVRLERAAADAAWQADQRAAEAERRRRRFEDARATVPAAFQGARFALENLAERVKRPEAIAEARETIGRPVVLLTGGAGAGKTTLAACIMHDVIDRALAGERAACELAWSARWTAALMLERARREHRLGEGEAPEVRRAVEASLLIVDDLGQEAADRDRVLTEVIYERHAAGRATVITTGKRYPELVASYGDGIARRLTEAPAAIVRCAATTKAAPPGQLTLPKEGKAA